MFRSSWGLQGEASDAWCHQPGVRPIAGSGFLFNAVFVSLVTLFGFEKTWEIRGDWSGLWLSLFTVVYLCKKLENNRYLYLVLELITVSLSVFIHSTFLLIEFLSFPRKVSKWGVSFVNRFNCISGSINFVCQCLGFCLRSLFT